MTQFHLNYLKNVFHGYLYNIYTQTYLKCKAFPQNSVKRFSFCENFNEAF